MVKDGALKSSKDDEALPAADAGLSAGWHVRMVGQLARKTVVGAFIGDSFMAAVLMRHGDWMVPLAWLAIATAAKLARAVYVRRLERLTHLPIRQMVPTLALWFLLVGVTQSAVLVLAYLQGDRDTLMYVSMIMMAMAGAGVGTSGGIFAAYVAWAIPFAAAIVGVWAAQPALWDKIFATIIFTLPLMLALYSRDYSQVLDRQQQLLDSLRIERDRAEVAIAAKRQFFAAASHDLRQPLAVLRWYGDAVLAHARELQHEPLQAAGEGISRAVDHAEPLVRRYLEIARIEAGAVSVQWVGIRLDELLQSIVDAYSPTAQAGGLELRLALEDPPSELFVRSDPELLRSVIDNIVGNAVKFTPSGGVTIAARRQQDQAVICIQDTGVGIAKEDQAKVFDDFYQAGTDNLQRDRRKGIGLGLAIARRQMALLGIHYELNSEPGKGSQFTLHVPCAHDAQAVSASAQTAATGRADWPARSLAVLLLDDEAEVRSALSSVFDAAGWPVRTAAGTNEALEELAKGYAPDVLVLDYRLAQGMTGGEALSRLRQAGCRAPAIFVTGDVDPTRLLEMSRLGVPVLHKPVKADELLRALASLKDAPRLP